MISHFPDLKAGHVAWFYSHSEVCDDNIVEQLLHGIEPEREPLWSSGRPVLFDAFKQLSMAWKVAS